MKKFFSIAILGVITSSISACSSKQTAWCSLEWPGTEKTALSGDCRFNDQKGEANNASVDFYSQDYSFVFTNSNDGKNYERQNSYQSVRFNHNGNVLTIFPEGKPARV